MINDKGGVIDDIIITRVEGGFNIILNAACKDNDIKEIAKCLNSDSKYELKKDFVENFNGIKRDLSNKYLNRLHRDECARIIAFALKEELYLNNHLFNCSSSSITYEEYFMNIFGSQDFNKYFNNTNDSIRKISSERLRELGFVF